jgi:DNA/RNA-binding domain of Phe-tRNA-synthetase-like protein
MPTFQYHPDILAQFPDLRAGIVLAEDLNNGPSPPPLRHVFLTEQRAVLEDIGDTPLSEIETLAAWRAAFRAFGVNPTKYRSAPEALLRRLTKKGNIPSINALVDICNLVSIRYALPVASFDTHALQGPVTVHFADGSESFVPLGEQHLEHPEPGEVIFSDPTGRVIARRWCWRQSDDSAARPGTRQAILTVEALHAGGQADVASAVDDLLALIDQYAGGSYTSALLDSHRAAV